MIGDLRPCAVNPPPIPPTTRFRPKASVLVRELDGEAVLLDLETGRYFGLNATGVRIWALLGEGDGGGGGGEVAAIRDRLAAEYALAPEAIAADLVELCQELETQGLVHRIG